MPTTVVGVGEVKKLCLTTSGYQKSISRAEEMPIRTNHGDADFRYNKMADIGVPGALFRNFHRDPRTVSVAGRNFCFCIIFDNKVISLHVIIKLYKIMLIIIHNCMPLLYLTD